ncbi:hypothetical protein TWF106_006494 [Orbilia oligospora]|uniref:DUF7580 domain-containing protein n=1 Tax=Orbilia oligospora TaxID=2813651 RepID=A0A7C8UMH4_ORBOL|nr:hypothetical protein TWF106_006494 [Orbilia oligospora]
MSWKLVDIAEWLPFRRQVEGMISNMADRVGTNAPHKETEINVQAIRSGNYDSSLQAELLFTKQLDPDQEMPDETMGPALLMLHRAQTDLQVIQKRNCATGESATGGSERLMRGSREKAKILTTCTKLRTYSKNLFRALVRQSSVCDHPESQHEVRLMLPKLEDYIDESVSQLNMFLASPGGKQWHKIKCKTPNIPSIADDQP